MDAEMGEWVSGCRSDGDHVGESVRGYGVMICEGAESASGCMPIFFEMGGLLKTGF
jgi:hypothetical protein